MTEKRFEVIDHFDIDNKPIKAIRDNETTEIYTMDNGLEANSTCMKLNALNDENEQLRKENQLLIQAVKDVSKNAVLFKEEEE